MSLYSLPQNIGAYVVTKVRSIGQVTLFTLSALLLAFTPPFNKRRILEQMYFIGVKSVFVVSLTAFFTGMVLGLQGYYTLTQFGSEGLLGAAVGLTLIRELGPVLAALMVTGRAGSSIAAELGTMRISEQIDALDTMSINSIRYLVSPKLIAAILCLPMLTALFNIVGIIGGYFAGVVMLEVNAAAYLSSLINDTTIKDVTMGLTKPMFFGFIVAAVSCFRGFYCDRLPGGGHAKGAASVSQATTSSVVIVSVFVLVVDYILTAIFF